MNQSSLEQLAGGRLGIQVNHFLTTIIPPPKSINFLYISAAFVKYTILRPLTFFVQSCTKSKVSLLFVFPGVQHLSSQRPSLDSEDIRNTLVEINDSKLEPDQSLVKKLYSSYCLLTEIFRSFLKDILIEKRIDFMTAPYSSEAQLRTLLHQGAITQIFSSPKPYAQLLSAGQKITIISRIERKLELKVEEVFPIKAQTNWKTGIQNQLFNSTLSLDYGMVNLKTSRLSSFAFLCLNYGLLSSRTATLFHSHSLEVQDLSLRISVFPYSRIIDQTQVALGLGSKSFINQEFLQQATFLFKNLKKQIPIKHEAIHLPSLRSKSILSLCELIRQFQSGELLEREGKQDKSNYDMIATTLNQVHLHSFILLNYIHSDNSYELLYQKIFLEIQTTLQSHVFNSLSLILLELLQAGLLSYQSLHASSDFVSDYIGGKHENSIRFISRVFCIRHAKFKESLLVPIDRIDTDLLRFSSVVHSIKESLDTVGETVLCHSLSNLMDEDSVLTPQDFQQIQIGSRILIKDIEFAPELGMIIKGLLQGQRFEEMEFLKHKFQKEEQKVVKQAVYSAIRETYEQVWRRVEILFEVVQKHHSLNHEFQHLIEKSSNLLREKLKPLI